MSEMRLSNKAQPDSKAPLRKPLSTPEQGRSQSPPALVQTAAIAPHRLVPRDVLYLQRTVGNHAVAQLLGRTSARGPQNSPSVIQPKLTVGPVNDRYEREADQVGRDLGLLRAAAPTHDRSAPSSQALPSSRVQRTAVIGREGGPVSSNLESRIRSSQGSGQTLPDRVRHTLEPKLGADLSGIKVHTDAKSVQLNRELGSRAFTNKNHIYYGAGQSPADMSLTAHEAVHTIQQGSVQALRRKNDRTDGPSIQADSDSGSKTLISRTPMPSIQRAVGIELECSNLEIVGEPEDAQKGAVIDGDKSENWTMTYEETSEGTPVVEFVVNPAAETENELTTALDNMRASAELYDKKPIFGDTYKVNGYELKKSGSSPIAGDPQITIGVPLDKVQKMYEKFEQQEMTAPAFKKMQKLEQGTQESYTEEIQKKRGIGIFSWTQTKTVQKTKTVFEKAPDGTPVKDLSDALKGFLILIWDYIGKSYVPETMRNYTETEVEDDKGNKNTIYGGATIPFAKGLFTTMSRTNFNAIFDTLPRQDQDLISEYNSLSGEFEMKEAWYKWIIQKGTNKQELTEEFLAEDPLINPYLQNQGRQGVGPKRSDWLKHMPTKDLLMQHENGYYDEKNGPFLGLGALGRKADKTESGKDAPIFELRRPYGSPQAYTTWNKIAKETWDRYETTVGEKVSQGTSPIPKGGRGLPRPRIEGSGLPPLQPVPEPETDTTEIDSDFEMSSNPLANMNPLALAAAQQRRQQQQRQRLQNMGHLFGDD